MTTVGVAAAIVLVLVILYSLPQISQKNTENLVEETDSLRENKLRTELPKDSAQDKFLPKIDEKKDDKLPLEVKPPKPENNLAFAPNEDLEAFLREQTRDEEKISDIEPKNGVIISGNLLELTWQTSLDKALVLELMNNQNQVLKTLETNAQQTKVTISLKDLPEGLYYWRLLDNRNLYHVGKFEFRP